MNQLLRHNSCRPLRAVAFIAAFACLWMATIGVLGHTDEFGVLPSTSHTAVWNMPGAIAVHLDTCAACDWLAALHVPAPSLDSHPIIRIFRTWLFLAFSSAIFAKLLHQSGSRAPPHAV